MRGLLWDPLLTGHALPGSGGDGGTDIPIPDAIEDAPVLQSFESCSPELRLIGSVTSPESAVLQHAKWRGNGARMWSLRWTAAAGTPAVQRSIERHWVANRNRLFGWRDPATRAREAVYYAQPPSFRRQGSRFAIEVMLERPLVYEE